MRVAVTGGSGVVGRAVIRQLVEAGHEVRALARSDAASAVVVGLGAEAMTGDVVEVTTVEGLAAGCEIVFHVAGVNEMCSKDPAKMWRVNVDGTRSVLEAARRAGARRMVHTSSAVTIGEERGNVGTEETTHRGYFLSEYERSKVEAERIALAAADGIEVVAVNPSSVQGPGRSTGTGALFLAMARGRLPILVDTTISVVDIDDCARGHLFAAERGRPGQRYLLSGATLTVREAVGLLDRLLHRKSSPRFVKPGTVTALAPLVALLARITGRESSVCPESARVLLHGHRYDGSRATRDLGLAYTPIGETLARTLGWFRSEGMLLDR